MVIRCMRDHLRTRTISLHRSSGLDFVAASSPGTLGGISNEQILTNANSAKQLEINASAQRRNLFRRLMAMEGESQPTSSAGQSKPRFFLDVGGWKMPTVPLMGSIRNGSHSAPAAQHSRTVSTSTPPTAAELHNDANTSRSWFGAHLNLAARGTMVQKGHVSMRSAF